MATTVYEPARLTAFSPDADAVGPDQTVTATFGMGCFWGPDARFGAMDGVVRTRVAYAGGTDPDPSYDSLGDHTEVVQVEYDPETVAYEALLDVFWANHDPFSDPLKRQYRGVVLTHDDAQHRAAHDSKTVLADRTGKTVQTAIEPFDTATLAEPYHQKYELRSTPVVSAELTDCYGSALVDSTVAARLNGFVAGHGDPDRREAFLDSLGLPLAAISEVRRRL